MRANPVTRTVRQLLDLRKEEMLKSNPEYQRGEVWTVAQKKRLVDSVLRGYPIPLIYLHHIKRDVAGFTREGLEVIDGQQRINALYQFREGGFKLFDPVRDEEEARFPSFLKDAACPWGGKDFDSLDPALQHQFLETPLSVVMIETDVANEARDLFIRLQAGMPLNAQEKRDAWPGSFTEYVLKVGGKPQMVNYPGHDFFKAVMKAKEKNRGEFRQLAAQMFMLFLARRESGGDRLCDINGDAIDTFYYTHLNFDAGSAEARRFHAILTLLTQLLGDGMRKRVVGHEAMHLVLLVDSLLDDYTRGWEQNLAAAFDQFRVGLAEGTARKSDPAPNEFWTHYGQWTRASTPYAEQIQRRHQFFVEKMYGWIKPVLKDPTRLFGPLERELIYYRDKKLCQVCGGEVRWADAETHHVEEHAKGGATVLDNGALVHRDCHPKGAAAVTFAERWKAKRGPLDTPANATPNRPSDNSLAWCRWP